MHAGLSIKFALTKKKQERKERKGKGLLYYMAVNMAGYAVSVKFCWLHNYGLAYFKAVIKIPG